MILEPSVIVLYVDNLAISSQFYQDLFGIKPEETSPTFHSFKLSNGMGLGLKAKHAVEPASDKNGSGELAFTLDNRTEVDTLFVKWQEKGIDILASPSAVSYGYTFLAQDPDGNRLRVVSLVQPIVEYVEGFTVTGFSVRTQNSIEFDEKTAKLPELWQKFNSNNPTIDETVFGVYSDYESDVNGFYTVTAGIASKNEEEELKSIKIKSGNYLIFKGKGEMPKAIIDTWKTVWSYFTVDSLYKRCFMTDFEAYGNGDEVAVYIGIE